MSAPPNTANRQKEVAALALSAERVAARILDRIPDGRRQPTIVLSMDEYIQIGLHMTRLAGVAKEYHALIAGGAPTRDEVIHLNGNMTAAASALALATRTMAEFSERMIARPLTDEDLVT